MLSALLIVSLTTIERISRFASSAIWTYFRKLMEWSIPQQWMNMANNWSYWEHFPGGISPVAATDETSLLVYLLTLFVANYDLC